METLRVTRRIPSGDPNLPRNTPTGATTRQLDHMDVTVGKGGRKPMSAPQGSTAHIRHRGVAQAQVPRWLLRRAKGNVSLRNRRHTVVDGHHASTGGHPKGVHRRVAEEKRIERALEEERQIRADKQQLLDGSEELPAEEISQASRAGARDQRTRHAVGVRPPTTAGGIGSTRKTTLQLHHMRG
jgi:hypothetical protein